MTTTDELAAAVASDPRAEVGDRIVEPGTVHRRRRTWRPASGPASDLACPRGPAGDLREPGVYWLGVHVLGTAPTAGRDGRRRPGPDLPAPRARAERRHGARPGAAVPQPHGPGVRRPAGVPRRVGRRPSPRAAGCAGCSTSARRAPSDQAAVAWWSTPRSSTRRGRSPRATPRIELAPPPRTGDGRAPATARAATEDTRDAEARGDPGGRPAAARWLDDFVAEAEDRSVLRPALRRPRRRPPCCGTGVSDLLTSAFASSTQLLAEQDISATPSCSRPPGCSHRPSMAALEPGLPVVLAPDAVERTPTAAPLLEPAPTAGASCVAPLARRHVGTRSRGDARRRSPCGSGCSPRPPCTRCPRRATSPSSGSCRPAGTPGDRLAARPVLPGARRALAATGRRHRRPRRTSAPPRPWIPRRTSATPTPSARPSCPLATVLSTESLIAEGSTVEELVTDDSDVDEQVIRQALLTSSVWSRLAPRAGGRAGGRGRATGSPAGSTRSPSAARPS